MQLSAISLAITRIGRAGAAGFSPLSLFANSEVGAWYDPSDLTTMFQDRAGTTPVTADGQTVGKILDKSGRGNHAVAPSDAARPLYKTDGTYHWLQFDGVNNSLSTASNNFGRSKVTTFCGFGVGVLAGPVNIYELSTDFNASSGFVKTCDQTTLEIAYRTSGYTNCIIARTNTAEKIVTSDQWDKDLTVDEVFIFRKNGVQGSVTRPVNSNLTVDLIDRQFFIGSRGGLSIFFVGNIYSIIVRGALSTTQEITDTEKWVSAKTGVTL